MTGPRPMQRIEPLSPEPVPAEPVVPSQSQRAPKPVAPERHDVLFACRFPAAAGALAFVGVLRAIKAAPDLSVLRDGETGGWWVTTEVDLQLGRQLARMVSATAYVASGDDLLSDPGFGPPPVGVSETKSAVSRNTLVSSDVVTLIRTAGVQRVPVRPVERLRILLDGAAAAHIIRRTIDLGLNVRHRPVRLSPLFPGPAGTTTLIELAVSAYRGNLPPSLVTALTRDPAALTCRIAGSQDNLLIEHTVAAPLDDHLLAGLVDAGTWVLAASPFGCRRLDALGEFADSAGLVQLGEDYPLIEEEPPAALPDLQLPAVRVVPRRTEGQALDAVLVDDAELSTIRLLLEGDPLADTARIILGRDRHLLVAPGGILVRIPVGQPLYALGPGPLYLPLGCSLRPHVPPSARRELFRAGQNRAVVLTPRSGWVFDPGTAMPVWALWVGDLPELVPQSANDDLRQLLDDLRLDQDQPGPGSHPPDDEAASWHELAMEAELAGRLKEAADLHRRNASPLRAARLYERAAAEAQP